MKANYTIICLPLGRATRAADSPPLSFPIKLVSKLSLPPSDSPGNDFLNAVVDQHPLLSESRRSTLRAVVWTYEEWKNGQAGERRAVANLNLVKDDKVSSDSQRRALKRLMGLGQVASTSQPTRHSPDFDKLKSDHFVDVNEAMDNIRSLTQALVKIGTPQPFRKFTTSKEGEVPSTQTVETLVGALELGSSKWLNGCVQAVVNGLFLGDSEENLTELQSASLEVSQAMKARPAIARALTKLNRRHRPDDQRLMADAAHQGPTPGDLNVVLQSCLKNELLSRTCGFVTTWRAFADRPLPQAVPLVVELNASDLFAGPTTTIEKVQPTAFFVGPFVHPASYSDIVSGTLRTGVLAALTEVKGTQRTPRYRASSINSEQQITKQLLVQGGNSLGRADGQPGRGAFDKFRDEVDRRGPDQLKHDRHGFASPDTSGVIFSAPVEDLVTPDALKAESPEERSRKLPCVFLEDVWIGYRLDLRNHKHQGFTSTHRIRQRVVLADGSSYEGDMEDFVDREQPDDDSRGYSSTDLTVYNGFTKGQTQDYLIAMGNDPSELTPAPNHFYTLSAVGYGKTEALRFGEEYEYQLRTVLVGGCSTACDELGTGEERYRQSFPFFRSDSLKAGVVIGRSGTNTNAAGEQEQIVVSKASPKVEFTIIPAPIDVESARYQALLFHDLSEPTQHKQRRIIRDVGRALPKPPSDVDYFCDPDVYGVSFRVSILNGAEPTKSAESIEVDGAVCTRVQHLMLPPIAEYYGKPGDWEHFRPIVFTVVARNEGAPKLSKKGLFRGCQHIELELPPACHARLSLLPLFDVELLQRHASMMASSSQYVTKASVAQILVPTLADQVIQAVHAVPVPRYVPSVRHRTGGGAYTPSMTRPGIASKRTSQPDVALLSGSIEVDAPSTKEVWLEATWSDIVDSASEYGFTLQTGVASTKRRNVVFQPEEPEPPNPRALADLARRPKWIEEINRTFTSQCVESKILLAPDTSSQSVVKLEELGLPDSRRRMVSVEAVGTSRFGDDGGSSFEQRRRSPAIAFDVPSATALSAPKVAYAVPLKHVPQQEGERSPEAATFAMRIYLHGPAFESGPGERIAIACVGDRPQPAGPSFEVPKHVTQWGEDPIERAKLAVTRRMPVASDFSTLQSASTVASRLNSTLYPAQVLGGSAPVLYRDNALLPERIADTRRVGLASFALRFDRKRRLWYFDVAVDSQFFGWCGLALYRHQPHSVPGFELSSTAAWVYASVLYEEPVVWTERLGALQVTVGPVYDIHASFELESLQYVEGVSVNLEVAPRRPIPMRVVRIGRARYFEGVVDGKNGAINLVKLRFGQPMQSRSIRGK